VSKRVSSASQIADKALGPPRTLSPVAASPGPSWDTLYKAVSATRGCPGLSPVAKVGDLANTEIQFRHDAGGKLRNNVENTISWSSIFFKLAWMHIM
jgi:hypothetical protein